jgi:hypothetical protein
MIATLPAARVPRLPADPIERARLRVENVNILNDGFLTTIPCVPEDATAVGDRGKYEFYSLSPRNDFHAWLVQDIAVITIRLERVQRIERRERDRIALRATSFWDADRRLDAEHLGAKLGGDPAATVAALQRTPQGCDWLMARWAMLARIADRDGGWDAAQTALAFDMLGTPHALRKGSPGEAIDHHGRASGEAGGELVAIARGEVDRLLVVRDSVIDADALDRALAQNDMTDGSSPELRRLRRYEASLHKRLRWNLHQLQQIPKFSHPHPDLKYLFDPEVIPEPPAAVVDPTAPEEPDPAEVEREENPSFPVARSSRPDPVAARAEARRKARQKKHDRSDD